MTRAKYMEEMARVHSTERWDWVSIFVNGKEEEIVTKQIHDIEGVSWDSEVERWRVDGLDGFYCTFDTKHEAIKYCWSQQIVFNREVMLTSEAFEYLRETDLNYVYNKLGIGEDFLLKLHNR